jgi:hypothetical protein
MITLRSNRYSLLATGCVLYVTTFVVLGLPGSATAEGGEGRPWGRLDKPQVIAPESTRQSGYLGRYNPWARRGEDNASEESSSPPRYRQRENNGSNRAEGLSPYSGEQPVPSYAPMPRPYYGYGPMGGEHYSAPSLSPYPGSAPWGGGMVPDYGGYLPGPYNSLQPDTGILWSDMWR